MDDIWFEDTPMWMDSTTISQFLDAVEGTMNWSDEEKKTFALNHLKGPAYTFSEENLEPDMTWADIKLKLFEEFKSQMDIWVKFDMKKKLSQKESETIRDFYNRCVTYQYLLCDDYSETVLDNEIMVNFLILLEILLLF